MATLIPVAQWTFCLYKVTYHKGEDGPALFTRYLVSTDTHVRGEIESEWPGPGFDYYRWEFVRQCERPHQIGTLYGVRIDESGWSAGERESK